MTTYHGSCHCGQVAFEARGEIGQVVDCNCSMCRRRGGLLWFVPRADFTLETPAESASTYTFNTHRLRHRFCPTCGVAPFSEGEGPRGPMAAVNVRCLADVDLDGLTVVPYDGKNH